MTASDPVNPLPDGGDDHYRPWLRNGGGAGAAGAGGGTPAPAGVHRPGPLPTQDAARAPRAPLGGTVRQGATLSAEELLARPIPVAPPPPPGPTAWERARGAAAAFADWTMMLGARADVPARVARLELGRRSGAAAAWIASRSRGGAERIAGVAQTGAAAAAPRLDAAGRAARAALARGTQNARGGLTAGAARVGSATRSLIDTAGGPRDASSDGIESQLDRLLADEAAGVPPRAAPPVQPIASQPAAAAALPLFPADSAPAAAPARAAPSPAPPPRTAASGDGGRPWHRHPGTLALGGAALLAAGFAGGQYWTGPGVDRATTERVIHDYLLNNPEILPQAMQRLQARTAAATVERLRDRIETPFSGAWAGAADGDVTLTVFTDYACTFCRASVPDIERLLREDRRLKVVFRELPILSPDSEPAARLALAAARRGRYMPMHRALFAAGTPGEETRRDAAIALDVANDSAALGDAAITREIRANVDLARELGFDGTPSWVVGDRLLTGAVGYDQLKAAVAAARAG